MLNKSRDFLEYLAIRCFAVCPFWLRRALASWACSIWYAVDIRHRDIARENFRRAFPDADEEMASRSVYSAYCHLGLFLAELPEIINLSPSNVDQYVDWKQHLPLLRPLLAEGNGVVFVSGHLGNWEFFAAALAAKGLLSGGIVRPMNIPYVNQYIRKLRTGSGVKMWDGPGALPYIYESLREGKGIGFFIDQDAGQSGRPVSFFGQAASTDATHVDLSLCTGAPIVVLGIHRTGTLRFALDVDRVIRPQGDKSDQATRLLLLEQVNQGLESLILRASDQYLWQNERWKTRIGDPLPADIADGTHLHSKSIKSKAMCEHEASCCRHRSTI